MPDHALALLNAYNFAREGVIWIALLLLIKGHTDLSAILTAQQTVSAPVIAKTDLSTSLSPVTWPGDGMGSLIIQGDLTVRGCILWQQEVGLFQNSCTVLTNLILDCIHGVLVDLEEPICKCEPHWTGPLCDIHDCYGRGIFELNTGECECKVLGYTASSKCQTRVETTVQCNSDLPIPPGEKNCYGQCVDGMCICTKPGQLGLRCMQCAYPQIDASICPGRTNWGVEYIDKDDNFAVCGGGYEISSASIVVLRGLNCITPNCQDFLAERSRCCNPLFVSDTNFAANCPRWLNWTYNKLDFSTGSIFSDSYRMRYLQILKDHMGPGCNNSLTGQPIDGCLRRSYKTVQESDWPFLEIDRKPMRGHVIYLNGQSLGMSIETLSGQKRIPAVWSSRNTTIYLQGTGIYPGLPYIQRSQLYFIVYYIYPYVFCLADKDADLWTQFNLKNASPQQMYWINLLDQPGIFLPMEGYCGMFHLNDEKFMRQVENAPFPGSRLGSGYWWPLDQGTVLG